MSYKASEQDGVVRLSDGKFIAANPLDADWLEFQDWQAAGGILGTADATPAEYAWYIDIGPFFDRFGAAKLAVLSSTNPIAKAVVTDAMVRKWIDLKLPSVAMGVDALISQAIPGVDLALKDAIINTPVSHAEQAALIKLYFD